MNFKKFQTEQKLRGGYYTPPDLADFLVRWVAVTNPTRILEPSCGDGVFIDSIARHIDGPALRCFELDRGESKKARVRAASAGLIDTVVSATDFLSWANANQATKEGTFDAVVGNPPFVRYQYLPAEFQAQAQRVFETHDCKFTKHTNAWVPFILASFAMLRPGGRLAMVVPAEVIHVTHAQSLRTYLGKQASRILVVDPEEIWFEDTLQGAVLLLAEKKKSARSKAQGMAIHPVRGRAFLDGSPEAMFRQARTINGKTISGKWTRALLGAATLDLLDEIEDRADVFQRFDQVAEVDVGIVTGANDFFLVNDEVVERYGLSKWSHPMFGRSDHCPGIIYDSKQHESNSKGGKPTNFLWFNDDEVQRSSKARAYIRSGEEQDLHTRYKCRIRKPWYVVPSVYSTEVGMLKRAHDTPRLILNKLGAYTTDTAYRVRSLSGSPSQLVTAFMNAVTAVSAELEGRHYGGGVLELVPSEIEKLLLPRPELVRPGIVALDRAVRSMSADDVLDQQSKRVLTPLGLSAAEQHTLLSAWKALRDRRQRVSQAD